MRKAARADEALARQRQRASHEAGRPITRSSERSGRCASRGSARRRTCPTRRTPGRAGRTPPCRPSKLGDYLRDLRALLEQYGYELLAVRPLRPGLRARAHRLRPRDRGRHRQLLALHRRGGRSGGAATAARSPASTATARRAPNCCRRCTATGAGAAPSASSRRSGIPQGRMNPGKVVDAVPRDLEPAPRRRLPAAASSTPCFSLPQDTAASSRRRCAASASASAGTSTSGVMCPSYMATREEKHSTRGRARLLFEMLQGDADRPSGWRSRRCTRRSTSASPARAARATARSRWTWPPTRPSSTPTTTPGRLRPRAAYSMGLIQ